MCDYSEQDKEFLGAIRLLEDTDSDGKFDKSSIYADKISWPTAVLCFDGGVFVGAAPHIYYLNDTDGDGKADERNIVFTGFDRRNVQGLLNSFRWGLDSRIHGATSTGGGTITRPDDTNFKPVNLSGRDFSFDPRKLDIRPESGGAQHGMSFDDWGRKFVCSNSDHIQLVMFDDRYAGRNPLASLPSARLSIAADGPQAEVFRRSPVEQWRVIRTKLRVDGVVPGAVEGGGRPAGYFTGATGTTIYRGNAFPDEFRGQAFVGDAGSNLIHRKVLEPNGVELIAKRVDEGREFLASSDIWFRPAQYANAPDGTLYIADVHREVIEHPDSLPAEIKKHLDLTNGRDRGRIYRVVPEDFEQPALPMLGAVSTAELVATLEHRNGWHRDTAARLLYERQDQAVVPLLRNLVADSKLAEGRMHALYVLQALGGLDQDTVLLGLNDQHPRVREHAIRLAETMSDSPSIAERLLAMTNDVDILVRYQLAFTLGELPSEKRFDALSKLALRDVGDRWIRSAILSSLCTGAAEVLDTLVVDENFRTSETGRSFLAQLAEQLGAQSRLGDLQRFETTLASIAAKQPAVATQLVRGVMSGLKRHATGKETAVSPQVAAILKQVLASSMKVAGDESLPLGSRQDAIESLALGSFSDVQTLLAEMLESQQPQELQLAAVEVLGRFSDDTVGPILLSAWPGMSPRVRSIAAEALFSRPVWIAELLAAVEAGDIAASEFDPARLKQLSEHSDTKIRGRAKRLSAKLQVGSRQDVLTAYQSALSLTGDLERGRAAFRKTCAACHRLEATGHEIGPNLAAIKNRGADAILLNVLDPNREVNPQFVNYLVQTDDGRTLSGMIASETAASITLKRAENASDTVLRSEIEQLQSTGQSIMPEGMEKQIDPQTMADLIAYLLTVK
jgi:putative membrane-bound dehydrogenase-like protein